jgi:hypothetical protein
MQTFGFMKDVGYELLFARNFNSKHLVHELSTLADTLYKHDDPSVHHNA